MCDFCWGGYRRHSWGCCSQALRAATPSGPSGALRTSGAWCAVVLARSISASRSVQNSPCSASWWRQRYKTLPACRKSAKSSHFGRAGRVLYRKWAARLVRGEFCTGSGAVRLVLGEFCTAHAVRGGCAGRVLYRKWAALGSCCWAFPAHGHWDGAFRTRRCAPRRWRWGFCTTRSPQPVCRRRVAPSCSAIPPRRGACLTGEAPKTQTTSPKNDEIGPFGVKWSAFWAIPATWATSARISEQSRVHGLLARIIGCLARAVASTPGARCRAPGRGTGCPTRAVRSHVSP